MTDRPEAAEIERLRIESRVIIDTLVSALKKAERERDELRRQMEVLLGKVVSR